MNQSSSPARPAPSTGQSRRLSVGRRRISSADAEAMDRAAEERAAKLKEETVRYRRSVLDVSDLGAEGEGGSGGTANVDSTLVGRPVSVSISA